MRNNRITSILLIGLLISMQLLIISPIQAAPSISSEEVSPITFSPDNNGLNDSATVTFDSTAGQTLYLNVFYNGTQLIRSDISVTEIGDGSYRATWQGKDDSESYVTQEGTYTLRISDQQGSGSGVSAGTVDVDLSAPTSLSLSINGGSQSTTSRSVNLTISATGATKMKVSNDASFTNATWETYSTTKEWQLSTSDGEKTVYINFRDAAGTNSSTSDTITLDSSVSTPTLSINSGAGTTNNRTVTLGITASDATYMKIDNNTDFSNMTDWITKTSTYTFTLPSGGDGSRTVYLKVRDDAGNVKTTSDSITVDTTAPTGLSMTINDDESHTNNRTVSLTTSASGGPDLIWLSNNGEDYTSFEYDTSLTWNLSTSDGLKTVYYKVSDTAGNNATAITSTITLDTLDPSQVTLASPSAGASLTTQTPTFQWTNPNSNSSTRRFYLQILQSGSTVQSSYTNVSTTSYTATTLAPGSYTWKVTVFDLANNSAVTSQRSFSVSVTGLAIPSPTYPTSNARVNDTTPRLRWSQVSGQGTITYDYKYGLAADNLNNTGDTTNLYADTIEYADGQTIYWSVRARNSTEQSNYSTIRSFTVDTTAPLLNSIVLRAGQTYATSRSISVTLDATGASWMKLSEDPDFEGVSWQAYSSSTTFTLSSTDGEKTVYFIAKDSAVGDQGLSTYANINTTAINDTIILDTEAPTISSLVPSNGGSTTTTSNLPIQATLADAGSGINTSLVTMTVDDSSITPTVTSTKVSYTLSSASEGTHTVNVTATDEVGNTAYANWSFEVTSDSGSSGSPSGGAPPLPTDAAPVISDISHSPINITKDDTVTVSATVTDDSSIISVDLYYDDGTLHSTEMTAGADDTYTATIGPFPSGSTITYYIIAIDSAPQQTTSSNQTFSIQDETPPTITIVSPAEDGLITDTTPLIKATLTDSGGIDTDSIVMTLDGTDITDLSTITSTSITYTPGTPLALGEYTITLTVSDLSGNQAITSWSFTIQSPENELIGTIDHIDAGETGTLSFDQDTGVTGIEIVAAEGLDNLTVTLTSTNNAPSGVTEPDDSIYLYLVIETDAENTAISSATITFIVEKTWLTNNNIDADSVVLMHYDNGEWTALTTQKISEDSQSITFEAETQGFSTFAITGETTSGGSGGEIPIWIILIVVIVIIIILLLVLFKLGYISFEQRPEDEESE